MIVRRFSCNRRCKRKKRKNGKTRWHWIHWERSWWWRNFLICRNDFSPSFQKSVIFSSAFGKYTRSIYCSLITSQSEITAPRPRQRNFKRFSPLESRIFWNIAGNDKYIFEVEWVWFSPKRNPLCLCLHLDIILEIIRAIPQIKKLPKQKWNREGDLAVSKQNNSFTMTSSKFRFALRSIN